MKSGKVVVILLLLSVGFILVILPDNDVRLFSISENHGPSLSDASGLALFFVGYAWLIASVWKQRVKILRHKKSPLFIFSLLVAVASSVLIVVSVVGDYGNWWILGAALLAVVQGLACFLALRQPSVNT